MADSKQHPGSPDRDRINVNEDYELRDWSRKFGVTPEELKNAVKAVGVNAREVEAHLASAGKGTKKAGATP
jgi:hypothetical protein